MTERCRRLIAVISAELKEVANQLDPVTEFELAMRLRNFAAYLDSIQAAATTEALKSGRPSFFVAFVSSSRNKRLVGFDDLARCGLQKKMRTQGEAQINFFETRVSTVAIISSP